MSSILTFGGFALSRVKQKEADAGIEMALEAGINHVDVSPIYGEAEARLGSWFGRHGNSFFLGCKTAERTKTGAWEGLQRSLETLKVDHFDLYQFHMVDNHRELDTILGREERWKLSWKPRNRDWYASSASRAIILPFITKP